MNAEPTQAELPRYRWCRAAYLSALVILTGGCGGDETPQDRTTERIVASEQWTPASSPAAAATATSPNPFKEGDSVMQRADPGSLTAVIPASPMPAATLLTRKTFIDPPLPDELTSDGDLTPLPPLARSTDR